MKTNIRDGATFDLFMRELKAQTSHLGGLVRTTDLFFEEKYQILGDFSCYSMFTRRDILEFLNPFFIISENRGRAVAIKKENMLCYLERQQRGGRSSFDYIQSVIYSIFIGDNFLARKILYYNPKTKTISGVCNEDRG